MQFTVVAISRTLGAGGEELGTILADELGYRYVDSEIIDRAAALARVAPAEIARVEDRAAATSRVLQKLDEAATGGTLEAAVQALDPTVAEGYEHLIVDVIRETAAMGFMVIVAHGASIPLAGMPGLLRVLVTASPEVRAERVATEEGVGPTVARERVAASDQARADYFARFFGVVRELPTHYDLLINTDVLSVDHAARALLAVIRE
ncbi:MAG: cytidylate kinase-like family protein [Dehalococcoidia bacterium]|nr:cytidylate kinase-like family protein [Dehalococcoidia bacterium]